MFITNSVSLCHQVSCGWGMFRPFKYEGDMLDMASANPAPVQRIDIYHGSPRGLLYLDEPLESEYQITHIVLYRICLICWAPLRVCRTGARYNIHVNSSIYHQEAAPVGSTFNRLHQVWLVGTITYERWFTTRCCQCLTPRQRR